MSRETSFSSWYLSTTTPWLLIYNLQIIYMCYIYRPTNITEKVQLLVAINYNKKPELNPSGSEVIHACAIPSDTSLSGKFAHTLLPLPEKHRICNPGVTGSILGGTVSLSQLILDIESLVVCLSPLIQKSCEISISLFTLPVIGSFCRLYFLILYCCYL